MRTAEQLALSISLESRGIQILLWNDQEDLVRALLVLRAALHNMPIKYHFVSGAQDLAALKALVAERPPATDENLDNRPETNQFEKPFWILFVPQASSKAVGPLLNGWRRPISEPPGSLIVVRQADFESFQRSAPDLASFVGPRISNAGTMLSLFSEDTYTRIVPTLPEEITRILKQLPGTQPKQGELVAWLKDHAPIRTPDP